MKITIQTSKNRIYQSNCTNENLPTLNVPMLNYEQYTKWQDTVLARDPHIYRVRRWGDPVMTPYGFSYDTVGVANFQAVGLYNKANQTVGGVSNFIRVPTTDFRKIAVYQQNDEYLAKREDWVAQKLGWLTGAKGTIYFWFHAFASATSSKALPYIEWGTIQLGGNLVYVEDTETIYLKLRNEVKRNHLMARIRGFRTSDWDRSLTDLLANGLVQRCFCAYKGDKFGDSPKGIVYSPFWSPRDWTFIGPTQAQPDAFYIPMAWLSK